MKASDLKTEKEYVSTGISAFDAVLGGGLELGAITELFGEKSVGKSTLGLQIVAAAQKQGLDCLYCDTERTFTPQYAALLGVDNQKLELTRFRIAEDTFDYIIEWVTKHKRGIVVLDSMGGVLPREESEKTAEAKSIGLQSRLMGAFCRKVNALLDDNNVALIIVNHKVVNINTGALGSSGGAKLEHFKRFSVYLKPSFGKQARRATDGSKRDKWIEAELRKEKGINTREGRKADLLYDFERGFINEDEKLVLKRGRKAATE